MSKNILLALALLGAFSFLGCESKSPETLKSTETINLTKILEQTPEYVGKKIVIDGNYFPACSNSNCTDDFILRSGVEQIKIFTMGNFKFKDIKHAQALRVEGVLRKSSESPFLEATVIEKR
ncbi:MAG: Unknown protein [uncultured Sulfurovum sp.]|uniref:Lipoprotein n=1 Tax=uncultured Sulfurovum sp. TaxID=269237 RepID=A0A6S6TSI9_9BACT|nr:MAG: Unknown protein [uncultured Sulfurovum sp.]